MIGFFLIGSLIASNRDKNTVQNDNIDISVLQQELHSLDNAYKVFKQQYKKLKDDILNNFFQYKEITNQVHSVTWSKISSEEEDKIEKIINPKDNVSAKIKARQRAIDSVQNACIRLADLKAQGETKKCNALEKLKGKPTTSQEQPNDSGKGKQDNNNQDINAKQSLWTRLNNFIFEHQVISTLTGVGLVSGAGYAVYNWYTKKSVKKNTIEKDTTFDDFINYEENDNSSVK